MSEVDRLILLFILTVGFWTIVLYNSISLEVSLVGAAGSFVIAMFWLHLLFLEKENKK